METVEKQTTFFHRSHSPYCCWPNQDESSRPKTKDDRLHKILDGSSEGPPGFPRLASGVCEPI